MFLWILALHFVADFPAQSHWMAANKSKDMNALNSHVTVYTTIMTVGLLFLYKFYPISDPQYPESMATDALRCASLFGLMTYATHVGTDAATSRITGKLFAGALQAYDKKDNDSFGAHIHDFFVIVGADQLIHAVTLYWSLRILGFPV